MAIIFSGYLVMTQEFPIAYEMFISNRGFDISKLGIIYQVGDIFCQFSNCFFLLRLRRVCSVINVEWNVYFDINNLPIISCTPTTKISTSWHQVKDCDPGPKYLLIQACNVRPTRLGCIYTILFHIKYQSDGCNMYRKIEIVAG